MAAADTTRLSVYGAPNDEVKVILNGFGAVYFGLIEGFTRSMSCPLWCARAAGSYALSAQDLAVYNLVLSEEIEGFDGAAHIETWNSDPAWQGVREVAEQLTGIDDWCEAIFAANVVFEPLVGVVPEPPRAARGTG
jgi:Methane/Phenol/Toluene Hydroxylase